MALLGTLAEFQVDDVLVLLGTTKKTGVLAVEAPRRSGRVWVDAGHVVGAEMAGHTEAHDVVFELLRLPDGKFSFESGSAPADLMAPQDVSDVLAAARSRLAEWRDIERVVPSLSSIVSLDPEAGGEPVLHISADDWRIVAAIGAGGPVKLVADRLGLAEFDACKAVKAVVDAQLAVVQPVADSDAPTTGSAAAAPQSEVARQLSRLRAQ
ncbi:MAG: resuscitation-promoting factor RpfA [Acidimicrobiaceae bacterium]|nr:resuscitation-promoting factor RpfA [Acidimicrobiaceae bacterium]